MYLGSQEITYWAPAEENLYGVEGYEAPVVFRGRWEERQQEAVSPNGDQFISSAVVYVPFDMKIGGYLARGNFENSDTPPMAVAHAIQGWTKIPDIRNATSERRALL